MTVDTPVKDDKIDRNQTGIRILLTLLFFLIYWLVGLVLGVVILFELFFTLITQRQPSDQVKRFANQVLSYVVVIVRYMTYHEDEKPFPFSEFPPELNLTRPANDPGGVEA